MNRNRSKSHAAMAALVAVGLGVTTLAGCAASDASPAKTPTNAGVFVPDMSGSTKDNDSAVVEVARQEAETLAATGGTLIGTPLNSDSQGDVAPNLVIDLAIPADVPDNDLYRTQYRHAAVAEVPTTVNAWLKSQERGGSDYQGALKRAANALAGYDGHRSMVIVGDGFASTGTLKTVSNPQLSQDQCRALADEGMDKGQLPSLQGITVRWIGGGRTSYPLPPQTQAALQQCWGAILSQLGADLPAGWWSAQSTKS